MNGVQGKLQSSVIAREICFFFHVPDLVPSVQMEIHLVFLSGLNPVLNLQNPFYYIIFEAMISTLTTKLGTFAKPVGCFLLETTDVACIHILLASETLASIDELGKAQSNHHKDK